MYNCNIKKLKVSTYLWFAEMYFANICSDDNMTLSLPTSLHLW